MKRFILVFLMVWIPMITEGAQAEYLASVATHVFYELSADGQSFESRRPLSLLGGYRLNNWDLLFEYSWHRAFDGTEVLFVSRDRHEWLFWGRRIFRSEADLAPFVGLAAGGAVEMVKTSLASEFEQSWGKPNGVAAAAIGMRYRLGDNLEVQLEGRAKVYEKAAPRPILGLGASALMLF